jgi:Rps23 Pro-64 3,4-dihydroxylase Tpa1-like proline 4-hydroxylase
VNPQLDVSLIASVFAKAGRVHIPDALPPECAASLYHCLSAEIPWRRHYNRGEEHFDLLPAEQAGMGVGAINDLRRSIMVDARFNFACFYKSFRDTDIGSDPAQMSRYFARLCAFLNSPAFIEFARRVTGIGNIATVDAQATLYEAGDFLTVHDDNVAGKNRAAAYVLNLTPQWCADWGGVLQFIARDGHVAEGYVPTFNSLNVLRVPQAHSVSMVAPFAPAGRYSVTGWFRTSGT